MAQLKNTTISDTGSINLPVGTTAQRPTSPAGGQIRYNTDINDTEYYDGAAWRPISDSNPEATGGTIVDTDIGGVPYRLHLFTNTGNSTFAVARGGEVEYLIVAGGGGGGGWGGGGGAGGLLTGNTTVSPQAYTVGVGVGGARGTNAYTGGGDGGSSSAFGFTAIGGGGGGWYNSNTGRSGGSGGGGGGGEANTTDFVSISGAGTAGQGNAGGQGRGRPSSIYWGGGGGGGAGAPGQDAPAGGVGGAGGVGISLFITGNNQFYAGGGGGNTPGQEASTSTAFALGGLGGGGASGRYNYFTAKNADDGVPNTGGGGGSAQGGSVANTTIGLGGSGIVVIRYRRNASIVSNNIIKSSLPNSSPTEFLVQEGLVLNLDASNAASYLGQGTTIRNLADDTNNGTINGSLAFETAAPNHGTFNFTNAPFVATSNFFLGNGPTAWTLNAWVRTTTTVDGLGQGAVASNASGGPVYSSIGINAGRISYWTYEGQWLRRIGNIVVNDNRWHMLTWVNFSNSTMAMHVDGILDVGNQRSVSGNNNPIDRFGGSWTARFDGRISQITINLNRFLTIAEIQQTFNATRWRFGV